MAASPRYASAATEFGSAMTANSSPSAGMIDRTGAENVSAASSGSRIVRSARSTRSAAPSANKSPPKRPPSAGSVVALACDTRLARVWLINVAKTPVFKLVMRFLAAVAPSSASAARICIRSFAMLSTCTDACSGTGGGPTLPLPVSLFPFGAL